MRPAEWLRRIRWWLLLLVLGAVFAAGSWWGRRELDDLMAIPAGASALSTRTNTIFWKPAGDAQQLRWKRIPTPAEARIVDLFPAATTTFPPLTTVPTTTTSTTTVPSRRRRP
jgi:hypothetical protein